MYVNIFMILMYVIQNKQVEVEVEVGEGFARFDIPLILVH